MGSHVNHLYDCTTWLHAEGGYVAESGLSGAMGPPSPHAGYSSDSPPGTPRLSAGLMACFGRHGVRLSLVLGHVAVDEVDHVWSDRRLEDARHGHTAAKGTFRVVHGDEGTRRLRRDNDMQGTLEHTDGGSSRLSGYPYQRVCLLR